MVDVVIAGGGVVGTAVAVELLSADPALDVVVVEPDPTYSKAATGKGTGGIRQLFTRPENILLSQLTLDVVENWDAWVGVDAETLQPLNWRANGYLFIGGPQDAATLERNCDTQRANGVEAEWIAPDDLTRRYPQLRADDLAGAVLSPRDGWLDPRAFFAGLQRKATRLGVRVLHDRVTEFEATGSVVTSARLAGGDVLRADSFVNAAGTWAPELVAPLGMTLPVEPMRRHEHYVVTDNDVADLPFVKDAAGLAIHAHHDGASVGLVDFDHPGGEDFTVDPSYYHEVVAPALRHRVPGAGHLTHVSTWTGLYDQNRLDGNAIIGNWPGRLDNLYVAAGFSGHGFMHALGVGRGLTEHIVYGTYRSIDLTNLGYQRVVDERPYPELGIR